MPRPDIMRPIKPAEEIKNGSITVATSEASFQNVDPDVNQHVASGDIVSGNTDRFDNINYYAKDGKLIPIVGQTPAAAYSLRALSGKTNARVVRLRRASDDAERDFSEGDLVSSESADLGANGGFDTDTVWAKGDGWSITGGQAVCDGTNVARSFLLQNGVYPTPTPWIKITFTIVACSDFDNAGFYVAATSLSKFSTRGITTPGTYSFILDRSDGGTANYRFYTEAGVTLTVDDASVVVYTPSEAELWALENTVIQGSRLVQESAYVTTWYDQSGNGNDATQATTARQPLLILAGVTNTENGKPALSFDGTNDYLETATNHPFTFTGPVSVFSSVHKDSTAYKPYETVFSAGTTGVALDNMRKSMGFGFGNDANPSPKPAFVTDIWRPAGIQFTDSLSVDTGYILSACISNWSTHRTDLPDMSVNGVLGSSSYGSFDPTGLNADTMKVGVFDTILSTSYFSGGIHELIIYDSDQSANRTKIEKSINDYYNIYAYPDKPLISDTNPEAAAAYSLRYLSDYPTETPVVRVRRGSDDVERDLRAGEIVAGTAGADLIINGDFSDGANNWNLSANWSVAGGQASSDGTSVGVCRQFGKMGLEAGNYFKVTFDIVACNDFTKSGTQHDSNIVTLFSNQGITSTGTYTQLVRTNGLNGHTVFYSLTGGTLTIDNVIVEPYTPSELELWVANSTTSWRNRHSAYVTKWYDQSGNGNHATQATKSAQPKLITAGVTELDNGKPAMLFDGVDDELVTASPVLPKMNELLVSVVSSDVVAPASAAYHTALSKSPNRMYVPQTTSSVVRVSYVSSNPIERIGNPLTQGLTTLQVTSTLATGYYNGAKMPNKNDAAAISDAIVDNFSIGSLDGSSFTNIKFQEAIIYDSDQSAKRISIENQINSYYGIY